MEEAKVNELMALAENPQSCEMTVDLEAQTVTLTNGSSVAFEIEAARKHRLLNGLDDIEITLQKDAEISAFEARQKATLPWLYRAV